MERRRKCQETGVDQAKCNGEMQKHEEENLSMDLANKGPGPWQGWISAALWTEAKPQNVIEICSSGDGRSREGDAMGGSCPSASCSLVLTAKTIFPRCLQDDL